MGYTSDDLKQLGTFLRTSADEALKKEPPEDQVHQDLMEVMRQLEAIRYNPLLFKSLLKRYDVSFSLMEEPLKKVALHINDAGAVSKALIQWRLTNGK